MNNTDRTSERNVVYARLRRAREFAGLSQGQVARMLGVHRPTITEIEAGRRRVSTEELSEFARIYDVKASWLIGEDPSTETGDLATVELAARELSKLKKEDRELVISLLRSLRGRKGSKK
jgi:transcriptional regulator with XRE-family HTH domain